jgi:hypothetical protein
VTFRNILPFITLFAIVCYANSPLPYAGECRVLDQVFSAATARSQITSPAMALSILEEVALGHTVTLDRVLESQITGVPGYLQNSGFKSDTVRAYAFRKIGESGLPRAVEFLANITAADIGNDSSQQIWPTVQVALRNARLENLQGSQDKIEFLKATLTEPHDAISNSSVTTWAVNQLCDRGAYSASPEIQKSIRARMERKDGEDEIRFCEARIQVVFRSPDRVKAIGSVLTADAASEDDRLIRWAIYKLSEMGSSSAKAELDRFAAEIDNLPPTSLRKRRLSGFSEGIKHALDAGARNGSQLP